MTEYECVVCGEEFANQWPLVKHEAHHTKEQTLDAIKRLLT